MLESIDDVERNLCRSAPRTAHVHLDELRERTRSARNGRGRKRIDRDFDALLESAPYFRAAARRSIRRDIETVRTALRGLLRRARGGG
jgi:hypothetical protein